ncbi:peptide chain release factor N(5)-glutamine methyltransferase [Solimicrobium silvestre]|uniref:Release factor glutamine methyltransferase n=1 Tax=Solimicrobium silvestre TaxID=2099400 RepID=A0A2S9H2Z4_9BURK|nr:peptide chain release factor N(5)-glutamine methyltransferase [Solimicrobium silvestre]PRC94236.1 Protein-(glutamine-N5) methyltransferase, release factor-specific [Solimicrobium silvestre]
MSQHSIANLLNSTTAAGTLPALETRLLMMHVLNKTRIQLITQADYELSDSELNALQLLIDRRVQGEPIAYLIGQREFFGLMLQVTPDVLIPRPDTELLVELGLQYAPPNSTVLDLGTGSGAIAIALAHQRADLQVWACDISQAALAVAQNNAVTHQCKITLLKSDWYAQLPDMQWQTIVSNPPYIVQHDPHLSQGDLRFEPINALTDHADGLSAYRQLIAGAVSRLTEDGWLLLEHGYDQAQAVRALLTEHQFINVQSWCDIAGIERVSVGQRHSIPSPTFLSKIPN